MLSAVILTVEGMVVWTDEQRKIVEGGVRNRVVYAGPGSGKTAVLTNHVATVVQLRGVSHPANVLALTFTRQAAFEMRQRLVQHERLSRTQSEAVQIGTFHAQVFRWLLKCTPDIPNLLRENEQRRLVALAAERACPGKRIDVNQVISDLTIARSSWPPYHDSRTLQRIRTHYEVLKRRQRRWDFDDILEEFCRRSEMGSRVDIPAYEYVLVDEFQDTNAIQWLVLRKVQAQTRSYLFVVGDDDQAIYGFRGTQAKWLMTLHKELPDAVVHRLGTNFRSDVRIVQCANRLIAHNIMRAPKRIVAHSAHPGECVALTHADDNHQYRFLTRQLLTRSDHVTIGVLARTRIELVQAHRVIRPYAGRISARVELRTFHEAKGREWDVVHVLNAVAVNPYLREPPADRYSWEEERRLFYVALTRAKHGLYIHMPKSLAGRSVTVSPFVSECGLDWQDFQFIVG